MLTLIAAIPVGLAVPPVPLSDKVIELPLVPAGLMLSPGLKFAVAPVPKIALI